MARVPPGMSGGPVVLFDGGRMFLFGIYTGVLYPDGPREDPERTTALGTVCSFTLMRSLPFAQPLVTVAAK